MQPGRPRPQGAVDEQVTGQPGRTGVVEQRPRLSRAGHRLTPVADHLDAVGAQRPQFEPVVQPADLRAGAFVHRDDPVRGQGVQRGQPSVGSLAVGQQSTRGGADRMVGVADQRALLVETGRRRQPFDALPQTASTPAPSARRPGPGRRADRRAPRRALRWSAPRSPATTIRPSRDPTAAGRGGPPRSRRSAAGSASAMSTPAGRDR